MVTNWLIPTQGRRALGSLASVLFAGSLVVASVAHAETAPAASAQPAQPSGSSSTVKIFDDSVFNLAPRNSDAPEVRKTPKGNTVYSAGEPNYNQEQRNRWLKACEGLQENRQAYRDCYESEKKSDLGSKSETLPARGGSGRNNSSLGLEERGAPPEKIPDPYDSLPQAPQEETSEED